MEKLEHPKPNREFIYSTFNAFADRHPWIGQENIRPKSIAREMFEQFRSFADYIKDYDLHRAEGVLLRHLSSVHKVLVQTVPETAKDEVAWEMEEYLRLMIRQVDSSLIQEWERMRDPNYVPGAEQKELRPLASAEGEGDITRDARGFTAAIRTRIFRFLRELANGDYEAALEHLSLTGQSGGENWSAALLAKRLEAYYAGHGYIRLDPEARNSRHTYVIPSEDKKRWAVQQVLVDPEGHNDWKADFDVDLTASRERAEPVITLRDISSVGR